MALPKRHWGNAAQTPGFIPSAACGRDSASFEREVIVTSATSFNGSAAKNPDWYCSDCAKAAQLALAAESAPKPDTVIWPKPRPISEAPTDGTSVLAHWSVGNFPRLRGCRWEVTRVGSGLAWFNEHDEPLSAPDYFLPLPPEVR